MAPPRFKVTLTDPANADISNIIAWTIENFGERQADQYFGTIFSALEALSMAAKPAGAKARNDLANGLYTLHIARGRRHGRHVLVYRKRGDHEILVLRILHDSMDIALHLPSNDES